MRRTFVAMWFGLLSFGALSAPAATITFAGPRAHAPVDPAIPEGSTQLDPTPLAPEVGGEADEGAWQDFIDWLFGRHRSRGHVLVGSRPLDDTPVTAMAVVTFEPSPLPVPSGEGWSQATAQAVGAAVPEPSGAAWVIVLAVLLFRGRRGR